MMIKPLYKTIARGMTVFSVDGSGQPDKYRLIADDGRAITDGIQIAQCIDTRYPAMWKDCDIIGTSDEISAEEALAIIMGEET